MHEGHRVWVCVKIGSETRKWVLISGTKAEQVPTLKNTYTLFGTPKARKQQHLARSGFPHKNHAQGPIRRLLSIGGSSAIRNQKQQANSPGERQYVKNHGAVYRPLVLTVQRFRRKTGLSPFRGSPPFWRRKMDSKRQSEAALGSPPGPPGGQREPKTSSLGPLCHGSLDPFSPPNKKKEKTEGGEGVKGQTKSCQEPGGGFLFHRVSAHVPKPTNCAVQPLVCRNVVRAVDGPDPFARLLAGIYRGMILAGLPRCRNASIHYRFTRNQSAMGQLCRANQPTNDNAPFPEGPCR